MGFVCTEQYLTSFNRYQSLAAKGFDKEIVCGTLDQANTKWEGELGNIHYVDLGQLNAKRLRESLTSATTGRAS